MTKSLKRPVSGILLLDKPTGITSNRALQRVKRLYRAQKAGHIGTLDPLASGMLGVFLGEATKISQHLLAADKEYRVTACLGVTTTTGDADGTVLKQSPVNVTSSHVQEALQRLRGEQHQLPPMYSALKHQGQPLYKYARAGLTVQRQPRIVQIYQLELLEHQQDSITLHVHCSKGTYVRTLIEDIGAYLGCGAHVTALRRVAIGSFTSTQMVTLEQLNACHEPDLDQMLYPLTAAVPHWPVVTLQESLLRYIRQGQAVWVPKAPTTGFVMLVDQQQSCAAIGEILSDGKIAPRKVFHQAEAFAAF